jgi:hypothetical protein
MEAAMDRREERMLFETDRYRIRGTVVLPRGGYRSRISDALNATERAFIPLTDVTIEPLNGNGDGSGQSTRHAFLALARSHIVFALTLDS